MRRKEQTTVIDKSYVKLNAVSSLADPCAGLKVLQ